MNLALDSVGPGPGRNLRHFDITEKESMVKWSMVNGQRSKQGQLKTM